MPRSSRLKEPLDRLYQEFDYAGRIQSDAMKFPLRYPEREDREVVALLSACLAYGRVDLFSREVEKVLRVMGPHPARFILDFDPAHDRDRFKDFRYRFNRPRDIDAFCLAVRNILKEHGSLRAYFLRGYSENDTDVLPALERFVQGILDQDLSQVFKRGGLSRGFRHLFPKPSTGGPCKRLHLFLRWMVRQDRLDFGLWPEVLPSELIIPLDTHIANMSRAIGLTRLKSHTGRMAKAITEALRRLDPDDPVKYDFALCHKRMSGNCPGKRDVVRCQPCGLRSICRHWRGGPLSRRGHPGFATPALIATSSSADVKGLPSTGISS